jgi:hypothetical protein
MTGFFLTVVDNIMAARRHADACSIAHEGEHGR